MNERESVYVAIYSHKHGTDVAVYMSEERAWEWADEIARTYWEDWYEEPIPTEDAGKNYFNGMSEVGGDEWFTVERKQIEEDKA